jgi:NTE family protein
MPDITPGEQSISGSDHRGADAGMALCLSGGGYRAMLFHLGTLWRLNEAGWLPKLDRISSVSGGSITSAVLGLRWERLDFDSAGIAQALTKEVIAPVRRLAGRTIDVNAVVLGCLLPGSVSARIAGAYRQHLFGDATLQNLPDAPRFVINATNIQSGVLWRFMKPYMRDYRVGEVKCPAISLAQAVAASSAFPPFLSPVTLALEEADYTPGTGQDLQRPPFTTRVILSDGGVYDNLGLETAWKRYDTLLVSDAGGHLASQGKPSRDWLRHSVRAQQVVDNQVRSLRKRDLIQSYIEGERRGSYWGIRTDIADYRLDDALPCPVERTLELAGVPTRLKRIDDTTQERLINWGYAVCDAALRRHVDARLPAPACFLYPGAGVG